MKQKTEISDIYSQFNVRQDIVRVHTHIWDRLSQAGTWLTGAEKVAIAKEARAAITCSLCEERKGAVSPYAIKGMHASVSELEPAIVDAIHQVVTDPGRLTKRLIDDLTEAGISDAKYIETLGVAHFILSIDLFNRAIGVDVFPLPEPQEGIPSQLRPTQTTDIGAWVPVLSPRSQLAKDIFAGALRVSNVALGLSLVPEITRDQVNWSRPNIFQFQIWFQLLILDE